jgi:predicted nucleotidyltransferase
MERTFAPEELLAYRRTALAREAREREQSAQRRAAAWEAARAAARILKQEFGAVRVVAFGSLARGAWFHPRSDIDLAVEGIAPAAFWRAWCALDRLASSFEFDLVPTETASDRLRAEIARDSVDL